MNVELVPVAEQHKSVLANLIQLYCYDFAPMRRTELTEHGTFSYRYLDHYFTEPNRDAYFIRVDGHLAGFALARGDVDGDGSWNISEFFVVRHHRRKGVAASAARQLVARRPGPWTLSIDHNNEPAAAFWPQLVRSVAVGPVTRTERQPPEVEHANTRLRFEVPGPAA